MAGRPPVAMDVAELEKLAALQCTIDDVAAWFGCARRTVLSRLKAEPYRSTWHDGQRKGLVSLRRSQFALAQKNAAMAIWLGKQYLGQREVQHLEHTGRDRGPIVVKSWADLVRAAGTVTAGAGSAHGTHPVVVSGNGHADPDPEAGPDRGRPA